MCIRDSPDKYFTDDIMRKLDQAALKEFTYGGEDSSDNTQESAS